MTFNRFVLPALALFLGAVCATPVMATGALQYPPAQGYGQDGGQYPPRGPFFAACRQGFQAGIEGALKDFGNRRTPDPNNREEYRHPNVPYQMQEAFREGFRRGYQMTMSELMGGGPNHDEGYWRQGPMGEARFRGFQDGMMGALHDFDNRRPPDPGNREEYRHPHVPYQLQEAYREGFRRGYHAAMQGLLGMPTGRQ